MRTLPAIKSNAANHRDLTYLTHLTHLTAHYPRSSVVYIFAPHLFAFSLRPLRLCVKIRVH